jgi:hypothetical protein
MPENSNYHKGACQNHSLVKRIFWEDVCPASACLIIDWNPLVIEADSQGHCFQIK